MSDNQAPDALAALREDDARCVRVLAACRRFAVNQGGSSGHYATFAQNEEVLLHSFQEVAEAHHSSDGRYDQLFMQRAQRAGLTPRDVHFLQERLLAQLSLDEEYD